MVARASRALFQIRVMLLIVTVILCVTALKLGSDFFLPMAMGGIFALALCPVVEKLEWLRLPPTLASGIAVLATAGLVLGGSVAAAPAVGEFMEKAPVYAARMERKLRPFRRQLEAVKAASDKIEASTGGGEAAPAPPAPRPGLMQRLLSSTPYALAQALLAGGVALFLLAQRHDYRRVLVLAPSRRSGRVRVARILRDIRACVAGYLFDLSLINAGVAVAATCGLWVLGWPDPLSWGLAFGAACYIPYIGPVAMMGLAALWGFATMPTTLEALTATGVFVAVNLVESNIVTPLVMARRTRASALVVFASVAFFAWLWGILGTLAAIPCIILLQTISRHLPRLSVLHAALSPREARAPAGNPIAFPPVGLAGAATPAVRLRFPRRAGKRQAKGA